MDRKGFAPIMVIGIVAIIVIVGFVGYFAWKNNVAPQSQNQPAQVSTTTIANSLATTTTNAATSSFIDTSNWKTFISRGGWTMKYPSNWTVGSCQNCSDVTAPDVFVGFYPPHKANNFQDDIVMVEPLVNQPSNKTVGQWLDSLSQTQNLNTALNKTSISFAGIPALEVLYLGNPPGSGLVSQDIYAVNNGRTFNISFSIQESNIQKLENAKEYSIYQGMLASFKFIQS